MRYCTLPATIVSTERKALWPKHKQTTIVLFSDGIIIEGKAYSKGEVGSISGRFPNIELTIDGLKSRIRVGSPLVNLPSKGIHDLVCKLVSAMLADDKPVETLMVSKLKKVLIIYWMINIVIIGAVFVAPVATLVLGDFDLEIFYVSLFLAGLLCFIPGFAAKRIAKSTST